MKRLWAVAVAAGLVIAPSVSVSADRDRAIVAPPGSRAHGMTYSERAAAWWTWAIALPAADHPLLAPEGDLDCSVGQSGNVWYLAGAFHEPASEPVTRSCEIPSGTALFLPLVNVECSTLETDPFFGADESDLRACVEKFDFVGLHASVDGAEITNLDSFLVESSPLFAFVPPPDNILGVEGGVEGQSVASGVHVLLQPLPVGTHVVTFGGTILLGEEVFEFNVVYELTVVPRGQFA